MTSITHNHTAADHRHVIALVLAAVAVTAVVLVLALAWSGGGAEPNAAPVTDDPPVPTRLVMPNAPRYDGGPEEGTRGLTEPGAPNPGRPDGGPEEGTVGFGH